MKNTHTIAIISGIVSACFKLSYITWQNFCVNNLPCPRLEFTRKLNRSYFIPRNRRYFLIVFIIIIYRNNILIWTCHLNSRKAGSLYFFTFISHSRTRMDIFIIWQYNPCFSIKLSRTVCFINPLTVVIIIINEKFAGKLYIIRFYFLITNNLSIVSISINC